MNTTYFDIKFNRSEFNMRCDNMYEAISYIEKALNEDRVIAENIIEIDNKSGRTVTVYKPDFSVKLRWTEIPKYEGETLVS